MGFMSLLHLHHHHHVNVNVHFQFGNSNRNRNRNRNRNPGCCIINQNHSGWRGGVSVSGKSVPVPVPVPARDRVIDFGKYKGKMLGSVPSSYLKWVSNNLRAGDFEEWANLADQVLADPIYRDRIEWEFAHNVLTGKANSSSSSSSSSSSLLLEEISQRFGWDNLDKVAWSQVDFDLLGTSKGARIPRLVNFKDTPPKPKPKHCTPSLSCSSPQWGTRMERRERQKMRLTRRLQTEEEDTNTIDGQNQIQNQNANSNAIANPFPGRQVFLQRAAQLQSTRNNNICF